MPREAVAVICIDVSLLKSVNLAKIFSLYVAWRSGTQPDIPCLNKG